MLSLAELRRAAAAIDSRLAGARLERVVQPDAESVVLTFYGGDERARRHLILACGPVSARVGELEAPPRAGSPGAPPSFAQYLRAHLRGARLASAAIRGDDRQLALRFDAAEGHFELLLALLGRRSNVYALDAHGRVVTALRSLSQTRDDLAFGEPWRAPASPAPGEGEDRFADVPDDALLRALEVAGGRAARDRDFQELARRVRQALRKEEKRLAKKRADVEADLAESGQARELERRGELLKSVIARVRSGDREVRARDFETGSEVVIPLDPSRSPKENLEAVFKRYRKLVRRLAKAGAQVDALREQQAELEGEAAEAEALLERGPEALAALAERAGRAPLRRWLTRYAPARTGGPARPGAPAVPKKKGPFAELPAKLAPRRYRSRDGLEIWVGRSDEGNDHLSTRLARGNDLFFHLDGAPGSHVVLRTEGRPDPPSDSVLDACELAVHFSRAKRASRADVHVAPIKNVRKPRGAKPGLVTVTGGRTVHLRREEARLRRLLDSAIDPD